MTHITRTVSIREFRSNLTALLKEAQDKGVHFVVMRHSKPVAHVTPAKQDESLDALIKDIAEARKDYDEGRVYDIDEVRTMIGI